MKRFEMWISSCQECPNFLFQPLLKETNKGGCKVLKKIVNSNEIDSDCQLNEVNVSEGVVSECEYRN